ncbi:MAG: hypothetical protein AB1571_03880 [Nanoarchaeota archaeon]
MGVTKEFKNVIEVYDCLKEHKIGTYTEIGGMLGLLGSLAGLSIGSSLAYWGFGVGVYIGVASAILLPFSLLTFTMTMGYTHKNQNSYTHGEFYSAAKKYIEENKYGEESFGFIISS